MTPCPLARPLLALCPVLLLLTAPCFPSDTGGWGGARVLHSTALNEKQCSVACSADTACSRSLFEKQDKKCYFYRLTRQERKIRADSRPTGGDTGYAFPQGEKTPVLQNSSSQAHGTDPASLPRGSVAALAGSQTDTGTTVTPRLASLPEATPATTISRTQTIPTTNTTTATLSTNSTTTPTNSTTTFRPSTTTSIPTITITPTATTPTITITTTATTPTTTITPTATTPTTTITPTATTPTTTATTPTTTITTTATTPTTTTTTTATTPTTTITPTATTPTTTITTTATTPTTTITTTATTPTTTITPTTASATTTATTTRASAPTTVQGPFTPTVRTTSPRAPQPTTTKRGDGSTAKATTNGTAGGPLSRKPVDSITLLAVLLFGLLFFVVTVVLFLRKAYESYQKRDYTQMDYLINGMYTDSGV